MYLIYSGAELMKALTLIVSFMWLSVLAVIASFAQPGTLSYVFLTVTVAAMFNLVGALTSCIRIESLPVNDAALAPAREKHDDDRRVTEENTREMP